MCGDTCATCDTHIDDEEMEAFLLSEDGINVGGENYRFCSWECLVAWVNFTDASLKKEDVSE